MHSNINAENSPKKSSLSEPIQVNPLPGALGYALIPTFFSLIGILQFFRVFHVWLPSMRFNLLWQGLTALIGLGLLSSQRQRELDLPNVAMRSGQEQKTLLSPKITLGFIPLLIILAACLFFFIQTALIQLPENLWLLLLKALFAAIAAEVFFRGLIFERLQAKGLTYAVILSSLLYTFSEALFYVGSYSLFALTFELLFAFAFSLATALLCFTTGRLWLGVLWHFMFSLPLFAGLAGNPLYFIWMVLYAAAMILYSTYLLWQLNKTQKQWAPSTQETPA